MNRSGTRKEELLLDDNELSTIWSLRNYLNRQNYKEPIEAVIEVMKKTENNKQFLEIVSHLGKKQPSGVPVELNTKLNPLNKIYM